MVAAKQESNVKARSGARSLRMGDTSRRANTRILVVRIDGAIDGEIYGPLARRQQGRGLPSAPVRLRNQQDSTDDFAALEGGVGLGRFLERVGFMDADRELALAEPRGELL